MLSSCTVPGPTIQETVGPISGVGVGTRGHPGEGYLEVRSQTETVNDGGITYEHYTPYSIYTPEEHLVKGVRNHVGSDDQKPMVVPLPEGQYVVYGRSEGAGRVGVSVLIVRGQITLVNLQYRGLKLPPDVPASEAVRLPDGRVIGRRATLTPVTSDADH